VAVERFARRLAGHTLPRFEIQLPDGAIHVQGGSPTGVRDDRAEPVRFRLRALNRTGLEAMLSFDELRAAEAFINGDFDVEGDFLAVLDLRQLFSDRHPFHSLWRFAPALLRGQVKTDAGAIPRHYDYGNDFYFTFLDKTVRLYSQALYRAESETLEQAARNKLEYIFTACGLKAGSAVIDVGAGWGSFATFAAARGVDVTMLTLAARQFDYLQRQAEQAGRPGRLRVIRENVYAFEPRERYDAVVLLGVMEHLPDYEKLMARFDRLVKPNGFVYMDFSAIRKKFNISSVVYRHVFPGNHTPVALADLIQAVNRSPFEPIALCNDRHSYYLTLRTWATNLEAARDQLVENFGQRTFRLFQLYLWATAHDFLTGALESYRFVLQKSAGHDSASVGLR
jgi:cyclopropane-fatty-acyl-phospholipid synthase